MVPFFEAQACAGGGLVPGNSIAAAIWRALQFPLIIIGAPEKAPGAPRNALPMTTATIRRLAIPSADELVERARALGPEIRALAEDTERTRNLSPHIAAKLREAEVLRLCRPRMVAGLQYDAW